MSEDPVPEGRDSGVNTGHVTGTFVVAPRGDTGQDFVTRSTHHWATTVALAGARLGVKVVHTDLSAGDAPAPELVAGLGGDLLDLDLGNKQTDKLDL